MAWLVKRRDYIFFLFLLASACRLVEWQCSDQRVLDNVFYMLAYKFLSGYLTRWLTWSQVALAAVAPPPPLAKKVAEDRQRPQTGSNGATWFTSWALEHRGTHCLCKEQGLKDRHDMSILPGGCHKPDSENPQNHTRTQKLCFRSIYCLKTNRNTKEGGRDTNGIPKRSRYRLWNQPRRRSWNLSTRKLSEDNPLFGRLNFWEM